jgi:hypothetical protein
MTSSAGKVEPTLQGNVSAVDPESLKNRGTLFRRNTINTIVHSVTDREN